MEDLIRLIIPNERLINIINKNLELSSKESHYINKVMRTKTGQEIYILNGKGYMWKAKKIDDKIIKIINYENPIFSEDKKQFLIGLAIAIPKNGFEDILKMSTEIGIDIFQPLISERQIKKQFDFSSKKLRWEKIINESVEQSERLWKPELLNPIQLSDWIPSALEEDFISISVTRLEGLISLGNWLNKKNFSCFNKGIIWNVIGPEGGWSNKELNSFNKFEIELVTLSKTILRTSTAAINASSILNHWRDKNINSANF